MPGSRWKGGKGGGVGIPGEGRGYIGGYTGGGYTYPPADMRQGYIWHAGSTHPTGICSRSLHNFTNYR